MVELMEKEWVDMLGLIEVFSTVGMKETSLEKVSGYLEVEL